ncbi:MULTISPECIES: beta/gamma crystallin-related protein [Hyphobacterium]|uniref:Beta/gamma crystallin-related protein n=1 Tax=Hyphobacterium vulgare TaxID=1736751 RepID=A0ABV6ZUB1_9PROT
MSLKSRLGLICGALFLLAPAGALQAQEPPIAEFYPGTPEIILYSQPNFGGQRVTLSDDAADLRRQNFNDRTWSIQVEAGDWEVCENINFGGRCIRVNGDVASFTPANWVSSVRLVRNGTGPGGGGGFVDRPLSGIRLFDGPNYTGQRFDTQSEIYDLNRTGFNDRTSSIAIAVGESWEVCLDSNFRSQCQVFSDNVRDLAQYGYFNNSISSVRRVGGGGWPGGPGGPGGPGYPGGPGGPGNWYTDIDGGIEGIGTMFFPVPEINGRSIDRCMASGGRDCDTAVADAICREAGFLEAAYFSVDRGRRYRTLHLGSGQECRTGRCEAMLNVLCISER